MNKPVSKISLLAAAVALLLLIANPSAKAAFTDVVNLGDAAQFTAIALNGNFTMSGPLGPNGPYSIAGNVGVAASGYKFDASGSQSISGNLYIHTGSTFNNSAPGIPNPQPQNATNDAFLSSASAGAFAASSFANSLTPTAVYGTISDTLTISQTSVGNYVFDITAINFSGNKTLTLNAPAGSNVILNISDSVVLTGGSILISGGLTSQDVLINYTGTSDVRFSGGGNSSQIYGTVLAVNAAVVLSPGYISGSVFADSITLSSGAQIGGMTAIPEMTSGTVIFGFMLLVLASGSIAGQLRRRYALVRQS